MYRLHRGAERADRGIGQQVLGDIRQLHRHDVGAADAEAGEAARHAQRTLAEVAIGNRAFRKKQRRCLGRIARTALDELPESGAHAAFLTPASFTSWLAGLALMRRSVCSARSRTALRNAWSRPARYCGGQYCPMCWYQAEACRVKYGLERCGRASASRSALPAASSVFTWSGVVTAPTVMVAMPTSLRTQSEKGAWYMRP